MVGSVVRAPIFRLVLSLVLIVAIGSCLAAPLAWLGSAVGSWLEGSALIENEFFSSLHQSIASSPFPRYYNRAILVAALIVLVGLRKRLGISGAGWQECGIAPSLVGGWGGALGLAFAGFFLAGAVLLTLGTALTFPVVPVAEDTGWNWVVGFVPREPGEGTTRLVGNLVSAVSVGVLEECLFRGLILAIALKTMRTGRAIVFVTVLFAILHFVHPPEEDLPREQVAWFDGWRTTAAAFSRLFQPQLFVAELCTLLAAGWVLVDLRIRAGTVWLPVGVHAGWVFGIKMYNRMTRETAALDKGDGLPWIGKEGLLVGILPLVFVMLTWLLVRFWLRLRGRSPSAEPARVPDATNS